MVGTESFSVTPSPVYARPMMLMVRLIVSAVVAIVFVGTLATVGVRVFYEDRDDDVILHHSVKLLTGLERIEMGRRLGEDWDPNRRRLPAPIDAPPPLLAPRSVSGFVQLEFEVDPQGRVTEVDIVGATPQGYFEEQARALVESRIYAPNYENGRPVASKRTELVDFTVPADAESPPGD